MGASEVINLGEQNSIFNQFIMEIRNEEIQKDSMRFRKNIERLGEIFAYEISKKMEYTDQLVTTPLGQCHINLITHQPIIATVLRAGLPLHQGFLNYFDRADNAFVSAYRLHIPPNDFEVKVEYISSPDLTNRTLILCDPMLATGQSMVLSYEALEDLYGKPKHVHVVSVISSVEGIEYVQKKMGAKATIWTGAIDMEMTAQAYIIPGLGDAGDLAFGVKE
jgi:uracil phosphoribosyltransferase